MDKLYHYKLEAFRLKQDAIPGRVITGWFQPTETGEYDIQCAEICGIGHGLMGARVHIETPESTRPPGWPRTPRHFPSARRHPLTPRSLEEAARRGPTTGETRGGREE